MKEVVSNDVIAGMLARNEIILETLEAFAEVIQKRKQDLVGRERNLYDMAYDIGFNAGVKYVNDLLKRGAE